LLPVMIVGSRVRVGVIGRGEGLHRRLDLLAKAGIEPQTMTADAPDEFGGLGLLFVAGLDEKESGRLAQAARAAGVLVNVEDMPDLCDFHVPAQVRRGDLLLAISTSGRSPGLARILREHLETLFGPEWDGILENVASARQQWRSEGLPPDEVSRRTRAMVHWPNLSAATGTGAREEIAGGARTRRSRGKTKDSSARDAAELKK
jgi:precorrin-2 dehydrogenase/sirohydrochlorin ferrochelatase